MLDCLACPLGLSTSVSPSTFKGTSACPCGSPAFEGDYRKALLRAGAVDVVCAALPLHRSEVELCTYANVFLFFMGKHIAASEKKDAASGEGAYQLVRQPCERPRILLALQLSCAACVFDQDTTGLACVFK